MTTHRYPHHTHTPLVSPIPTGARPPNSIPLLPHNTYAPWQPSEDHSRSPTLLPWAAHHDVPKYSHITQHPRALYIPIPSLPPKRHKLLPLITSRNKPKDPHTATARRLETQGNGAQREDPHSPDTELSRGTPPLLNHGQASKTKRKPAPPHTPKHPCLPHTQKSTTRCHTTAHNGTRVTTQYTSQDTLKLDSDSSFTQRPTLVNKKPQTYKRTHTD